MELIKRNTGYGLRALLHMAAEGDGQAFTAEELAEAADTSTDFMHKIMRSLRDAGIVSSKPGPSGGFQFQQAPAEVSVFEVVNAIQGPLTVNQCVIGLDVCPRSVACPLRPTWLKVQRDIEEGLSETTLSDIVDGAYQNEGDDNGKDEDCPQDR